MINLPSKGTILLISGPSGCGKSSLLKNLFNLIDNYYFSISTTTRKPRDGEKNGKDYFFVSKEEFEADIENGNFLEYATVHGNYYGTSIKPINKALDDGKLVIFDIDVQGYHIVKDKINDILTSVFITTPSLSELKTRLINRKTDDEKTIARRLKNATIEINELKYYDYLIINDDLKIASQQLVSLVWTILLKTNNLNTKNIVNNWHK
jgi:guanylate kinase